MKEILNRFLTLLVFLVTLLSVMQLTLTSTYASSQEQPTQGVQLGYIYENGIQSNVEEAVYDPFNGLIYVAGLNHLIYALNESDGTFNRVVVANFIAQNLSVDPVNGVVYAINQSGTFLEINGTHEVGLFEMPTPSNMVITKVYWGYLTNGSIYVLGTSFNELEFVFLVYDGTENVSCVHARYGFTPDGLDPSAYPTFVNGYFEVGISINHCPLVQIHQGKSRAVTTQIGNGGDVIRLIPDNTLGLVYVQAQQDNQLFIYNSSTFPDITSKDYFTYLQLSTSSYVYTGGIVPPNYVISPDGTLYLITLEHGGFYMYVVHSDQLLNSFYLGSGYTCMAWYLEYYNGEVYAMSSHGQLVITNSKTVLENYTLPDTSVNNFQVTKWGLLVSGNNTVNFAYYGYPVEIQAHGLNYGLPLTFMVNGTVNGLKVGYVENTSNYSTILVLPEGITP
ncbi:hypothetical protein [Sulfuracidifex tepidarius]|uniref:hypothetical protein n=1 Tax=Sulfuracidifex tepidarius TaxID=1294262 RepID=UPI0006D0DE1A|nr:hypothetical protein [Sulfuracidifex tepidarius]